MKHALVTGVAGFIGSAVANNLVNQGIQVVGVDNLTTGFKENIPEEVVFIKGNVQDNDVIEELKKHPIDTIYHIAGQSSGEISFLDPVYDLQTNAQSTLMLLNLARVKSCKYFIYASTMSVYGDPIDKDEAVNEEHPLNPISFYAVGKVASENYLKIYSKYYGLSCVSLRLFNVYGPGQNMTNMKQGMVSIFLSQALNSNSILVKGDKKRFRDQVYIDDVVDAFIFARKAIKKGYHVYNIATSHKTTVEEVVELIAKHIPDLKEVTYSQGTLGDQYGIFGDYSLAYKDFGWSPKYKFHCGFQKMFEWANNGGY